VNLKNLLAIFADKNCDKIYIKELSPNDNSKNQIYAAQGDTKVLNLFPTEDFKPITSGIRKFKSFHAHAEFYWIDEEGNQYLAPHAKFILYPDYPEVRFSGFLLGCKKSPSDLLTSRKDGRVLFIGISRDAKMYGFVSGPETELSNEAIKIRDYESVGFFKMITLENKKIIKDSKFKLLSELKRIHEKGWIDSKQLLPGYIIKTCVGNKCGGTTLEAELNIIQNGKSEPDYLGWEIKQFGVRKIHLINSSRITLMTPEPDGGFYKEHSFYEFLNRFGYLSPTIGDRLDFTGTHKYGKIQGKTKLKLEVEGYDIEANQMTNLNGGIYLIDSKDTIAASWSFSKILSHWKKKHAKASYIPSLSRSVPIKQFSYSNNIFLCTGTDFPLFMASFIKGHIYFDPGMHLEDVSQLKQTPKKRSQFRMTSKTIKDVYQNVELIDLNTL